VSAALYVVATPLGNLADLSPRAITTLREVRLVAAEDTRRTRTLLSHIDAHPTLLSVHAHAEPARFEQVMTVLRRGDAVALVSDAGTPVVSDPGATLVARVVEEGFPVVCVPGPSAVTAALSVSGFTADRYTFLGFLPRKGRDRAALLQQVADGPWTTVLFEAANRLERLLDELRAVCGAERKAVVARELTKLHEAVQSGTLGELAVYYAARPARGEVTLVVAGAGKVRAAAHDPAAAADLARALLAEGLSRKDAATRLAREADLPRHEAYRLVNEQ